MKLYVYHVSIENMFTSEFLFQLYCEVWYHFVLCWEFWFHLMGTELLCLHLLRCEQ